MKEINLVLAKGYLPAKFPYGFLAFIYIIVDKVQSNYLDIAFGVACVLFSIIYSLKVLKERQTNITELLRNEE